MTFDNSKSSQRQRDEASVELLRKLKEKLLSDNISTARLTALNLSWKQEDGLAAGAVMGKSFPEAGSPV